MSELWFQQNFMNSDFDPPGAVGADSQFGVSTYETVFLNGTFAWSPVSIRTSQWGPAYPMVRGVQAGALRL